MNLQILLITSSGALGVSTQMESKGSGCLAYPTRLAPPPMAFPECLGLPPCSAMAWVKRNGTSVVGRSLPQNPAKHRHGLIQSIQSMLTGKSAGNPCFHPQNYGFPVDCPLNQFNSGIQPHMAIPRPTTRPYSPDVLA